MNILSKCFSVCHQIEFSAQYITIYSSYMVSGNSYVISIVIKIHFQLLYGVNLMC